MSISIPIIDGLFKLIDKVIPDPQAKLEAQREALRMQQAGEFKQMETDLALALGQLDVNKIEAAAPDLFRGGWRPAVGWVCVIGLLYTYLGQPLLAWASGIWSVPAPPSLDLGDLLILLGGMLGLGSMRTMERLKGKA
jgi:holin (3TMs family)